MRHVNLKQNGEILFLIITLLIFAACSSGLSSKKSSKDLTDDSPTNTPTPEDPSKNPLPPKENPVTDTPSLEATRIICFQLNEDQSKIIGYYGIDINGESCPKDVVIPNGIFSIGSAAFENKSLTSVFFPQSVTTVEDNAFKNNFLTSLVIPNSVTSIGEHAFSGNTEYRISLYQ